MKKITFFFFFLFTYSTFAQFSSSEVKYFVGSGSKTAYLVVDFNDDLTPRSYVWGFRFDGSELKMEDLINAINEDEVNFNAEIPGGFLYSLSYNHHSPSTDDYWSTWSGTASDNMETNNGVNEDDLIDGRWYGLSYGFLEELDYNPTHPSQPIPAYSSQWYQASQITNWIGTGSNQSLIVIDFGTDTDGIENSFVFGVKYNEQISAEEALQMIADELDYFDFTVESNQISSLDLMNNSGVATQSNPWKIYSGTDLSNWRQKNNLDDVNLSNNDWVGLSFSDRHPFTPREATPTLSNDDKGKMAFNVYPNPTSNFLNIETEDQINEVVVYDLQGKLILRTNEKTLDVSNLNSGLYFLKVKSANSSSVIKFVKK